MWEQASEDAGTSMLLVQMEQISGKSVSRMDLAAPVALWPVDVELPESDLTT